MKKHNYARFYCLLKEVMPELEQEEAKQLVAEQASRGRTDSLRELTEEEFEGAIVSLSQQLSQASAEVKKARSKALHQLQKYGVDTTSWDAVNAFTSQARIAGKPFFYLDVDELEALTRKMRAINSKRGTQKPKSAESRPRVQVKYTITKEQLEALAKNKHLLN